MKEFFSNKWKYDNIILYTAILISFSLIAYYILNSGYSMSSDSRRFARWADELIKLNFNFFEFYLIDTIEIRPHLLFFSVPVFLIALCKVLFVNEDTEVTNFGEHLALRATNELFYELWAAPRVLSAQGVPGVGLHAHLEEATVPQPDDIEREIRKLLSEQP